MKATIIVSDVVSQNMLMPCIQLLCNQNFSAEYEVILPDLGNFTREAITILKQFEKEYPHFSTLKLLGKNRSELINQVAKQAIGDLLFFTESHCLVNKNWVADWSKVFKSKKIQVATGDVVIVQSDSWVSKSEEDHNKIIRNLFKDSSHLEFHNTVITKECFSEIGGLSEEIPIMAEFELGARLHQKKIEIVKIPEIKVHHFNDTTLSSYSQGIISQGKDRTRILKKHGKEFMQCYFPNPKLIKLITLPRSIIVPLLPLVSILIYTGMVGFKIGEIVRIYYLSRFFFGIIARNSLRYGQLIGLREDNKILIC